MSKKIMVVVLAVLLTGCVRYTNDKNERCTVSLDPTEWIFDGVATLATGDTKANTAYRCKPQNK